MKKLIVFVAFVCLFVIPLCAQEDDGEIRTVTVTEEPTPAPASQENAEPFLAFDLHLAPNTQGALEGSAQLSFLWSSWFESNVIFSVTNATSLYDQAGGSTTSIDSSKILDLNLFKTRSDFLRLNFDENGEFYGAINAGVLLNIGWQNQEQYGYGDTPTTFAFYNKQDVFMLYPFGCGELELRLGPFSLDGYFRQSLFELYTTVEGESYNSAWAPLVTAPVPFNTTDQGYETRFGGTATLAFSPEFEISYSFGYKSHIGHSETSTTGLSYSDFVYTAIEMTHKLTASFEIFGYRPVIGVTYINYQFNVTYLYSVPSFSSDRFGFVFGLLYE